MTSTTITPNTGTPNTGTPNTGTPNTGTATNGATGSTATTATNGSTEGTTGTSIVDGPVSEQFRDPGVASREGSYAPSSPSLRRRRARWPIIGVVAGVAGLTSAVLSIANLTEAQTQSGIAALDHLDRGRYHASFLIGLVGVAALFVVAAGWRRWAEQRAPRDLAARTIGAALAATATVNIIFVSLAGSMALYLPGGTDEGWLSDEAIFTNFSLLDFGQLLGWWGAMVAAGCVVKLALQRQRVLPFWMGVVSIVMMLPALAMAIVMALPGFVGLTMPIWLVVISIGLVFSRKAEA